MIKNSSFFCSISSLFLLFFYLLILIFLFPTPFEFFFTLFLLHCPMLQVLLPRFSFCIPLLYFLLFPSSSFSFLLLIPYFSSSSFSFFILLPPSAQTPLLLLVGEQRLLVSSFVLSLKCFDFLGEERFTIGLHGL